LRPPFFEFFFSLSLFFEKYVGFSIHTVDATVGIVRRLKKNLRTFVAKILATTRANKEIVSMAIYGIFPALLDTFVFVPGCLRDFPCSESYFIWTPHYRD
jgi:hypothetical protein